MRKRLARKCHAGNRIIRAQGPGAPGGRPLPPLMALLAIGLLAAAVAVPARAQERDLVARQTTFACDLFHELRDPDQNVVFSPLSAATALTMTYAGARGGTELQMGRVLHLGLRQEAVHREMADLLAALAGRGNDRGQRLLFANALWVQQSHPILDWYRELLAERYNAELAVQDYGSDPEAARRAINAWVAAKTEGRIEELVARGMIGRLTRLVLTNALYFRGTWAEAFPANSPPAPFHRLDGRAVEVDMMHRRGDFDYVEGDGFQLLEIPYRGGDLRLAIFLPTRPDALPALEARLAPEFLQQSFERLRRQRVSVYIPKFNARSHFDLAGMLRRLGMPDAFAPEEADFSGMTGQRNLYLSAVLHAATIAVDERGTEATAATAVVAREGSARPIDPRQQIPVFRADHPFLFLIRERASGAVLFLGHLVDPTG